MDWLKFKEKLEDQIKISGVENPPVEVYLVNSGKKFDVDNVYMDDGNLCIDIIEDRRAV